VDAKEQPVAMSGVERVPNYDKGTTTLRFGVQIFEDTAMFYERYAEPLTRLLDKVATVVKPSVVWSSQPQGACVVPGDRYSIGFPYQTRESGGEDTRSALVVVPTGRNANASSVRLRVYRVAGDAYRSSDVPQAALYAPEIAWSKLESRGYAALRSVVDVVVRVQGAERNLILEKRIRPFDYVPGSGGAEDARHRVTMYYAPGVGFVPWAEYLRSDDDTLHAELVGSSRAAYWGGICQATTMPFAVELPNETLKDVAFLTVELRPREGAQ
jgi:hypothetical protein